ncbi:type VI secretion system Vgr family protein [Paraburkholderia xenovorans]|uniref:type VI secretion system Vgr family protein n=1 Tax=Paraburkholderia xenovorans TaxID=36873 RepID=UPI0038BB3AA0
MTTQKNRPCAVSSPLGEDALLFAGMGGSDELGRLSEYRLELLSENDSIALHDLLGQTLSVRIDRPGGNARYFHGYVTQFAHTGWRGRFATYQATLHHWLWFLTRAHNCRVFQNKTVVEIIKDVFNEYPASFDASLSNTYESLPYCVQYRETDFAFVSRLMESAGIYYFFRQQASSHTLVLADSYAAHNSLDGNGSIRYLPGGAGDTRGIECIGEWTLQGALQTHEQSAADFNFEMATNREASIPLAQAALQSNYENATAARFDYPGGFSTRAGAESMVRTRMEAIEAQAQRVSGRSNVCAISPGGLFNLYDHPRADQNAHYLVTGARYAISYGGYEPGGAAAEGLQFSCTFDGLDSTHAFRTPLTTPRPSIRGPQTAFVTGNSDQEIWTDKYGRVKVRFHWDRSGVSDGDSSCWLRVAQSFAGKRWGALFLPRVGQEVVVEFLEGDPDRPLVTGTVYNAGMMPPYALPDNVTRSAIRSDSLKGGDTYSELRFDDKGGSEQLFLYAGRNQDNTVKNDSLESVGKDRHLSVAGNHYAKVTGDRHDTVLGAHKGKIGATLSFDVEGDTQHKSGGNLALSAGGRIDLKAASITLEADQMLTLKVGASTIVLGPAGVSICAPTVAIDGSATVNINGGGASSGGSAQAAAPQAPDAPTEADDGTR